MNSYTIWVTENPLLSAAIQFGLLGTLGEAISVSLKAHRPKLPGTRMQTLAKIAAWALLGIIIKYGFTAMRGFTRELLDHNLLPGYFASGFGWALALSVLTNLFFGPQMMAFHRWEDNLILGRKGYQGITRAWWTLIWFWIPAHTITFSLAREYQIGLAALWSVALGVIMGFSRK